MQNRKVIPVVLIVISLVVVALAFFFLPEQVVVQFSVGSSNSTIPKLLAILIIFAFSTGGAIMTLISKYDNRTFKKWLSLSVIGICLGIFTIVVNSFMK